MLLRGNCRWAVIVTIPYVKIDKIPENEGAKSLIQKVILEMRVQEMSRENIFFIKLIIADFKALFELY